jgi:predicted metalloprotease with PDZ domain
MALRAMLFLSAALLTAPLAIAQEAGPMPAPPVSHIPAPQDVAYPGTLTLAVDATDTARGVIHVHETIPLVHGGAQVFYYPQWLPGNHSPSGPIQDVAGLAFHAGDAAISWSRDPVTPFAFHVDAPSGARSVTVDFDYLSPVMPGQGRVVVTREMLNLEWNAVLLYPAGYFTRRIPVTASLKFPEGWQMATALETESHTSGSATYKTVDLGNLVDSPVLGGKYFNRVQLDDGAAPVWLDIVGDSAEIVKAKPEQIAPHKALVQQAYKLFGAHHYAHYDFLLGLSEKMSPEGLEHHQSSEDVTTSKYFSHYDQAVGRRDLLAHEYTHSWNGKFRRPADLWVPDYNTPMGDSLLWVYEGQTQFWGFVLGARSGLLTKQEGLDAIAATAAYYAEDPGLAWRPLEDTTTDPISTMRRAIPWRSYRGSEDYYREGQLIWLDADQLIREKTGGRKSLDDFVHAFFGMDNGSYVTKAYTFDDVVAALNGVMAYDWTGFLKARLNTVRPAPLDWIARGGYRLVFTDTPSDFTKKSDTLAKQGNFVYSLGLMLTAKGEASNVEWGSPAFKAGMTTADTIVAINDEDYDADDLKDAVTAAKTGKEPIRLLVKRGKSYRTVSVDYHGGLRYPHFERVEGTPARLDDLLAARK